MFVQGCLNGKLKIICYLKLPVLLVDEAVQGKVCFAKKHMLQTLSLEYLSLLLTVKWQQ